MTGPQRTGGGFRVDVDSASQAIKELEDALAELFQIREQAHELSRITPPSADAVSRDAALSLSNIATDGKGSFPTAIDEGIRQIQSTIDALRASLSTYQAADRL